MSETAALTPLEVIEYFGELTAIRFRVNLIPDSLRREAAVFAANFELWELRLVVEWTRMKIREGEQARNGFSASSLQWENMVANGGDAKLGRFQQRLGLALQWAQKHRRDLLVSAEVPAEVQVLPAPPVAGALEHGESEEQRRLREATTSGFRALKDQLLGLNMDEVDRLKSAAPAVRPALPESGS